MQDASEFYEGREETKLIDLLKGVTPYAAILINIEMSLVNPNLQEQGGTLALTLLPYLNMVTDYSFM